MGRVENEKQAENQNFDYINDYSNLKKAINVTAYCLRFINCL